MPKQSPQTSREGSRTRPRDPSALTARYVSRVLRDAKKTPAEMAKALEVSRGLITQWTTGQTFPSVDNLVAISLWSRVSLGVLSALGAERAGVDAPSIGNVEARLALLPAKLRENVLTALAAMESSARAVPPETWGPAVPNAALEEREWAAPGTATAKRVAARRAPSAATVKPKAR